MATTAGTGTETAMEPLRKKLVAALQRRGAMTFMQLQNFFQFADKDSSGYLSKEEFVTQLRKVGITLQDRELQTVFEFDKNKDGKVAYEEFLTIIRGPLNEARRSVVKKAFVKMDRDGSGVITVDDLRKVFSVRNHPEVVSGKKTEDAVLTEFLMNFEASDQKDGKVTYQEFEDYYAGISACIDDDRHFSLMLYQAWKL
jgi:Ca2+-binding EF-hand superfamily protein